MAVSHPWLFVAGHEGFRVFDLRHAGGLGEPVGRVGLPAEVEDLVLVGDLAYVLTDKGTIVPVDPSDPYFPRIAAADGLPEGVQSMALEGTTAYFATQSGTQARLHIYDVADPRAAKALAALDVPAARHLAVGGGAAYLSGYNSLLHVVDVRNPTRPVFERSVPTYGLIADIAFGGDAVYVADGLGGLVAVEPAFGAAIKPTPVPKRDVVVLPWMGLFKP